MSGRRRRTTYTETIVKNLLLKDEAQVVNLPPKLCVKSVIEFRCKCGQNTFRSIHHIVFCGEAYCPQCVSERQKEKRKSTCLQKYGVDNPQKLVTIRQKTQNTCLQKYGVDNP